MLPARKTERYFITPVNEKFPHEDQRVLSSLILSKW
jgi:hypothetical protein